MEILRYKIPLRVYFDKTVMMDNHPTYVMNMEDMAYASISKEETDRLEGQYDWIDAWRNGEYYKQDNGFDNKDVLMDVIYENGSYSITLLSEIPFDTVVKITDTDINGTNKTMGLTLKDAVVYFIEGCISDGIGENEIGHITYHGEKGSVWMRELTPIS